MKLRMSYLAPVLVLGVLGGSMVGCANDMSHDGTMMKEDTMKQDTMMKEDAMMKDDMKKKEMMDK